MMISRRCQQRRAQRGVALLEAMIAIVILALGLIGTMGLQARAYSAMNDAGARAEATIASQKVIGLMSTDIPNLTTYVMSSCTTPVAKLAAWCTDTQNAIPGANVSIAVAPAANGSSTAVTVNISWTRKKGDPTNSSTMTSYLTPST